MYLGSVRFFKNIILIVVCILILVPTALAFKYYARAVDAEKREQLIADDDPKHGSPDTLFEPDGAEGTNDEPLAPETVADPAQDSAQTAETSELSADPPAYQSLYEDFYAPQPFAATNRVENTVYLTFDDGPSDRTDEVLQVLAEKGVKATFFVIGQSDPKNLERMRKIVEAGHTIGMHSYSHDYNSVYSSVEGFLEEFYRIFVQIRETTGVTPTVFRCPGGSINGYNGGFYQEILSEMIRRGFVPYDWNVSSEDAATSHLIPSGTLVDNVVNHSRGKVRSFVLFHDSESKTTTTQALGPAIDRLRELGFEFAAITPDTMPILYNYTK